MNPKQHSCVGDKVRLSLKKKEMQMKTTLTCHFSHIRVAKIQKLDNTPLVRL